MALTSVALGRFAWGVLPAAAYFGIEAYQAAGAGHVADALGYGVLGCLFLAAPVISRGHVARAPLTIFTIVIGAAGIFAWRASSDSVVSLVEYLMAVAAFATLMVMSRPGRTGPPAGDGFVRLPPPQA